MKHLSRSLFLVLISSAYSAPAFAVPFMGMIQINNSDQPIRGSSSPFDFLFTILPTPTGDVDLKVSGVADVNDTGETISVLADTLDVGTHGPFASVVFSFPLSITGGDTSLLNDGELLVRLTLSREVNPNLFDDFLKVTLSYDTAPDGVSRILHNAPIRHRVVGSYGLLLET